MNLVQVYIKTMKTENWTPAEIRALRSRLGLYQKDFAQMIGVTERYVIYLEKGVKVPSATLKILLSMIDEEKGKEMKHDREK